MARIHNCPECQKALKVPASKAGAVVRCPGCKSRFRIPDESKGRRRSKSPASKRSSSPDDSSADFQEEAPRRRSKRNQKPVRDERLPSRKSKSKRAAGKKGKAGASGKFDLRAIIKRLSWIHCVVIGIALALLVGGFFSEYSSVASSVVSILAIVGCMIAGRIWMAIDIGKSNVGLGIAALLVPLVGLVISFRDKGPSLRGAATFVSGFVYLIPLGLALLLFAPDASGRPAFGPGGRSDSMNPEKWAERITESESGLTDETPVITAEGTVAPRSGDSVADLAQRGESLLSRFPSYQKGSFSIDVSTRRLTLQYRGNENRKVAYLFFLGLSTNNFVHPPPKE